ncbi:MAG: succinylglutamate desuccinylase [Candidatus Nanosalina sp. J07AB43]|nr:MAG: succinylglutamate desuccinylase [Candidatus Nanosalina sp. J07AB43]
MQVIEKGGANPDLVVVGSVHGDEPSGKKAVERLQNKYHKFQKPVKFIVANEKALSQGTRYVDKDLNSSFPGDPKSDEHEERLAHKISKHVEGKTVLDLHSTRSTDKPFANIKDLSQESKNLVRSTGVENSTCFEEESGVLIEMGSPGVLVETGPQGTEQAAEKSLNILENFLACEGYIDRDATEAIQTSSDTLKQFMATGSSRPPTTAK